MNELLLIIFIWTVVVSLWGVNHWVKSWEWEQKHKTAIGENLRLKGEIARLYQTKGTVPSTPVKPVAALLSHKVVKPAIPVIEPTLERECTFCDVH